MPYFYYVKSFLKKWITGISIPQEYVCLGLQDLRDPLLISITSRNRVEWQDITTQQLFLGYKPLVMSIAFPVKEEISIESEVCLHFNQAPFRINSSWKGFKSDHHSVARLSLKKIGEKILGDSKVVFYEAEEGWHNFISPIHQKLTTLIERFKRKSSGNVALPGNLYEQVRIAYSFPRLISLITVYDGQYMNLFPTDLHGSIGEDFYLGSLRIGGLACQQVQEQKRIVISEMDSSQFKEVYVLGKQHMQPMTALSDFKLASRVSYTFKSPLPFGVVAYRELEWIDFFDVGIHRVFIYKVVHKRQIKYTNTLAHVHCYYAQWRMNQGLITNFLFR